MVGVWRTGLFLGAMELQLGVSPAQTQGAIAGGASQALQEGLQQLGL